MGNAIWITLLSSSLVSAVVSGIVAGAFSLRAKRTEYVNEYYKVVLQRRIAAYEEVERLVINFKTSVVDTDSRPYHHVFQSEDEDPNSLYMLLFRIAASALWLSDELFYLTREFSVLLYKYNSERETWIEFGKKHYTAFADLRTKVEVVYARDMLSLHNIFQFLRSKKPSNAYLPFDCRR